MGGALTRPVPHLVWVLLPALPQGVLPTEPNRGGAQVLLPSRSRLGYPGVDCRAKRVGTGESQEDCGVQDPQALWPQHLPHFYWQRDMGGVQQLVPGQEKKAEVKSTVLNSLAVASHDYKQVQKIANYLQLQLPSAWQWVHVPGTTAGVPEIRIVLKF